MLFENSTLLISLAQKSLLLFFILISQSSLASSIWINDNILIGTAIAALLLGRLDQSSPGVTAQLWQRNSNSIQFKFKRQNFYFALISAHKRIKKLSSKTSSKMSNFSIQDGTNRAMKLHVFISIFYEEKSKIQNVLCPNRRCISGSYPLTFTFTTFNFRFKTKVILIMNSLKLFLHMIFIMLHDFCLI